mgnify:CR=1 FL=1
MKNYQIYIKLFFLIPIILLLFTVRIFKNFRINKIISHKIGHMTTPIEIYICEKKDNPKKIPVIWFFDRRIANQFLKKQWSKKLIILPRHVLEPIYILFKKYKCFYMFIEDFSKDSEEVKRSLKDGVKHIDDKKVLSKYKPTIEFDYKEKIEGEDYLKKIGFENKKFFAFASRTPDFHNEKEGSVRNTDINSNNLAVNFLISKGYKAIRMGRNESKKIKLNNPNIVDYASSHCASDFLDFYIISKCEFMISASTGITTVAALFRKPCLVVDELNLYDLGSLPERIMLLLKKIQNLKTGKIISFQEAYEKKLNYIGGHLELNKLGYKLIDNSEFEIKRATESFFKLINNYNSLNEILQNQKKYWQNVEKYLGFKNKSSIICPDFYSNNNDLFE